MSPWLQLSKLFLYGGREEGEATSPLCFACFIHDPVSVLGSELWVASLNNLHCCCYFFGL